MACPGSVNLSETLPPNQNSSDSYAAREGSCAHELAQIALISGKDADAFVGETFHGIKVTEEMAAHVQVYLNHVQRDLSLARHSGVQKFWVERKFSLAALNPPSPMFGTADFVLYDPETRTLYVDDLKYGQGVMVEVTGNKQTRYYALGALLSLDQREHPVERVVTTIIQPRKEHEDGYIRSETLTVDEVWAFARELLDAANATLDPNAPLVTGDHCRWCPARAVCPALRAESQAIAAVEFDEMPVVLPPVPSTIPPEQFGEMLGKLPILEAWIKSMKEHAENELREGREVPGHKLVERRARRVWVDPDAAAAAISKMAPAIGVAPADLFEKPELKSPAQVEKMFRGKKKFALAAGEHVIKKSSGYRVVPISDPSPEVVLTAGAEFELLSETSSATNSDDNEK